jgi:hypothetical protein
MSYLPVVLFTDGMGREHRFTSIAGSSARSPSVGKEVRVSLSIIQPKPCLRGVLPAYVGCTTRSGRAWSRGNCRTMVSVATLRAQCRQSITYRAGASRNHRPRHEPGLARDMLPGRCAMDMVARQKTDNSTVPFRPLMARIEHVALWTEDIERLVAFYSTYFRCDSRTSIHQLLRRASSHGLLSI